VGDARDAGSEEKFLDRWARRKQADCKGETVADSRSASTAAGTPPREAAPTVDEDPQQVLTDADMPSIDSLDGDSDFSVFMSSGVSEQLRTQALRKLFHMPAFNVTDGLNDYDEDYTQFTRLGNVVTQEMQRMLKRELEAEVVPEAEPVAKTEIPVEPADADLIAGMDEDGDDESSPPSRLSSNNA
jgi:hypothetical protein